MVKWAGSQSECALIRVPGLMRCALYCTPSKQDKEPVNDTKLVSLSVI